MLIFFQLLQDVFRYFYCHFIFAQYYIFQNSAHNKSLGWTPNELQSSTHPPLQQPPPLLRIRPSLHFDGKKNETVSQTCVSCPEIRNDKEEEKEPSNNYRKGKKVNKKDQSNEEFIASDEAASQQEVKI